ncbi:hypothetical protein [Peteryoungia ipomoeae]|uniref:Uncharacterized protein n=1 Tax=Peteryoungia ipomoeae TaxID=1210932 RepID=A0A4S8P8B8_9HYPH|nr:hypothetical protein [Peteryoungia ipomoeae]THV24019.1 hypothetical protein FAA97_08570 [Peteryoungia ipomoeae]
MDTLTQSVIAQTYWDKGLKYFKAGDDATTAIQNLYFDWRPPFDLNSLAAIIGALYANNYWAANQSEGQRMSVTTLAYDISAAIGINISDATRAAQFAFSRWYGLFVRANTNNSGEIPKAGTLTASPDVLVNGNSPLSPRLIITNWNQATWGPQPNLKNYAYGRAQSLNIGVSITAPTCSMYYTDAGFLPPPSSWNKVFTFDDQNPTSPFVDISGATTLTPQTRAATKDAFGVNFPGSGHYCMITAASSEFFTNAPDAGQGNWNSTTWLQYNGAAGWHNIDVSQTGKATLKFYNQDSTAERFVFEAHCVNMDEGGRVSMAVSGLMPTTEAKIHQKYQVVRAEVEIPANFTGELEVDFGKLPPNAAITFYKYWVVTKGHEHHRAAAVMRQDLRAAVNMEPVLLPMGDFTFVGSM